MSSFIRSLIILPIILLHSITGSAVHASEVDAHFNIDSLAFYHANRRIESLNFEERAQGTANNRVLNLLGQYQECLLRFLRDSEDEQIYLRGMQELFYRSAKVQHGSFCSVDCLRWYRFTDRSMKSQTVELEYNGHPCEAFYNCFKSNAEWTFADREELYQDEERQYLRDAVVVPRVLNEETIQQLQPNTIYNFVLLPDDTVRFAEERLGAREYHLAYDGNVTEAFTHPNHTILAGSANQIVVTAGAFCFVQEGSKRLFFVSNKSGHFRPYLFSLGEFRPWLARHGIDEATVILLPDLEIPRVLIENWDAIYIGDDSRYHSFYYTNYSNGVPIAVDKEEATRLLNIARRQWLHINEDIDRALVEALAAGDNSGLTDDTVEALNAARDRLNFMRCAYTLFLDNHESPPLFNRLVKKFGKLKDAIKHNIPERTCTEAQKLLEALDAYECSSEDSEVVISDEESFYKFLRERVWRINVLRHRSNIEIDEYHELKKYARDLAILFQLLTLEPVPVERDNPLMYRAAAEAFLGLNDEMREVHDRYVGDSMRGEVDGEVYITMPDALTNKIERYLGYVSPEPPAIDLDLTQRVGRLLLHQAASTWRMTHGNLILKDGVMAALKQIDAGEPVQVTPNLLQWLVTARKAADAMNRMCILMEDSQQPPEATQWYISQIDRILEAIPDRSAQTIHIPVEDILPFTRDKLTYELIPLETLDAASRTRIAQSLHHLVEGVRFLSSQEAVSPERFEEVQDQVQTLVVLMDMYKKNHYDGKKHRYEIYDALSRSLCGLQAQLDHDGSLYRRSDSSNTVSIAPETRRLANKVASKLRNY